MFGAAPCRTSTHAGPQHTSACPGYWAGGPQQSTSRPKSLVSQQRLAPTRLWQAVLSPAQPQDPRSQLAALACAQCNAGGGLEGEHSIMCSHAPHVCPPAPRQNLGRVAPEKPCKGHLHTRYAVDQGIAHHTGSNQPRHKMRTPPTPERMCATGMPYIAQDSRQFPAN